MRASLPPCPAALHALCGAMLAAAVLSPCPARADCENGVAALTHVISTVSDSHLQTLLQMDLKRAQFELWEFDEVECALALEHAERLLKLSH